MDPNETFRVMLRALLDRDVQPFLDHAEDLADWVSRDGFVPLEATRAAAAAPDLLAACELMSTRMDNLMESNGWREKDESNLSGGEWIGPILLAALDAIRAAIRKARGEEE